MKIEKSIRKRLLLSLIILAIVPLLLLGSLLSWQSLAIQQEQAAKLQKEIARRALNRISYIVHEIEDELVISVNFGGLMEMDRARQLSFLSRLRSFKDIFHQDLINELALLDSTGQEIAKVSRTDVFTDSDLKQLSETEEFSIPAATGEVYFSPVYFNKETGNPIMIMGIPVLDVRKNRVQGVLIAKIRLKFIWDIVAGIPVGETGTAYILDGTGRLVAHPNPSLVLRGTSFKIPDHSGISTGLQGTRAVIAYEKKQFGNQTLYIVTELPVAEALKQTKRSLLTIAVFLLLTLSCAIALGFVVIRQIIRPIEALSHTAKAISSGDLSQKAEGHVGNDEIGILASSFNTMTSRLIETIDSLKQRIIERDSAYKALHDKTQEIYTVNEYLKREIKERERVETALRESHERLLLILDSLDSAVYVADMKTYQILFVNKLTRRYFGDIEGKICWQTLQAGQTGPCDFCTNDKLLTDDGEPAGVYSWELQNTINKRWFYLQDRAIRWVDGRIVRIEIATDITNRKNVENKLKESEEKYRKLIETAKDAIFVADVDSGTIVDANTSAEELIGRKREEIIGMHQTELHPRSEAKRYAKIFQSLSSREKAFMDNVYVLHRSGRKIPVEISANTLVSGGKKLMQGIFRNITERKNAENRIRASLREKEVLLKEIHHRVKNNMQVISSLLNLQAEHINDKRYVEIFNDSRNRIRSMALVHEKLYQSKDLTNIDFNDYIRSLVNGLFTFYGTSPRDILPRIDLKGISLPIDTAVPCGLIINELISNSLKYAFPKGSKGEIKITLNKERINGGNEYELIVSDSGIGIPKRLDIKKSKSLGLQLVTNLVEHQLQGKINLTRDGGTQFYIYFKELKYKKRI